MKPSFESSQMKPRAGAALSSRKRVLQLEGGCNFRDIGGYMTLDGRSIRWGCVFRSGVLSYLSEVDKENLAQLGVRAIYDLRFADERVKEPTRWPDDQIQPLFLEDEWDLSSGDNELSRAEPTVAGMHGAMVNAYRAFPGRMQARLSGMFRCLEEGQMPLVIHCAAGKDRTGMAAAVLLSALGVARETVIEDYLLTNMTVNYEAFIARKESYLGLDNVYSDFLSLPGAVRAELFKADVDYLQAAFAEIDRRYGGMEAYLGGTLGVDDAARQRITDLLLF